MSDSLNQSTEAGNGRARWRAAHALSAIVAMLAALASILGLLVGGLYGEPPAVAEMLRGFDLVTLAVAVPLMVAAQLWSMRGSGRARLLWLAMLAYMAYTYAYHVFGTSFNDAFLLHIAVFGVSVFALVLTALAVGATTTGTQPTSRAVSRVVGVILGLIGLGLGGMWVYANTSFAFTGQVPEGSALVEPESVVHLGIALDLALLAPAYLLAAVLLWRCARAGFVLASVLLVSGTLHQISYMVALPFQASAGIPGAVAFDPIEPFIAALFTAGMLLLLLSGHASPVQGAPSPVPPKFLRV